MTSMRLSPGQRLLSWLRWYNSFIVRRKTPLEWPELTAFFDQAKVDYNQATSAAEARWQLSRYRWRFDIKSFNVYFEHKKGTLPNLTAQAQILGSHFTHTKEWHWSWSTPHIPKKTTRVARKLKTFGRRFGQNYLYRHVLDLTGTPQKAQALAALGFALSQAECVYQGQSEQQTVFFLLHNIQETQP